MVFSRTSYIIHSTIGYISATAVLLVLLVLGGEEKGVGKG